MKQKIKAPALFIMALAMLLTSVISLSAADEIAIDQSNFPDDKFRTYVQTLDTDKNGMLSTAERESVKRIAVRGESITDLTGIEYFPNLEQLYCAQNDLTKIDVSTNTKLKALNVSLNPRLGAIDISANKDLYWFACVKAGLQSLDVRNNTALTYLACGDNKITSLDLSQNILLEELYIESTLITSINLSNNPKLNRFTFASTSLTSLDLSRQISSVVLNDTDVCYSCSFEEGTISLASLPGNFDANKTSNWVNAKRSGDLLTVDAGAVKVTYDYDCGNGQTAKFALVSESFLASGGNIEEIETPTVPEDEQTSTVPEDKETPTESEEEEKWVNPYSDIADTHPNIDAIAYVTEKNVFQGTDKNNPTFSPEMTLTRAQLVTIFGRLAGVDTTKYHTSSFTDVDPDNSSHAWFAPYVEWASEQGLVLGYGNGKFGPTDNLTVEQTLVFLARYARYEGKQTDNEVSLEHYTDVKNVSSWAVSDMQWAVGGGIYTATDGSLNPKKITDRLLTATLIFLYDTALS